MRLTDRDVAAHGSVVRDAEFLSLGTLKSRNEATLSWLEDEKYLAELSDNPRISALFTDRALADAVPDEIGLVVSDNPAKAFISLHNHLSRETDFYGADVASRIDPSAVIHPTAFVADTNVVVGRRVLVEPGARLMPGARIGDDVIVRCGVTIASEGFEFRRAGQELLAVVHAGGVVIGDRVELQAHTTVDKSAFRDHTTVGRDTKTDDHVHIGHNAQIGERVRIAASAMLAGSVVVGDDVWIGPSAAISSGVSVGNGAFITIGSVVTRDVAPGERVSGNFAIPHARFLDFIRKIR